MINNRQIEAYLIPRKTAKEHEKKLLEIIRNNPPTSIERVLDIGCAAGNLITGFIF